MKKIKFVFLVLGFLHSFSSPVFSDSSQEEWTDETNDILDVSVTCTGDCVCEDGRRTKTSGTGPGWVACADAGGACNRFCSPSKGTLYNTKTVLPNQGCYDSCLSQYNRCLSRCPSDPLQKIYCTLNCDKWKGDCWARCRP